MNADTQRNVNQVLEQGWYREGLTLGVGGWGYLHKKGVDKWKTYRLVDLESGFQEVTETIRARDDETAFKAFSSLYRLSEFPDGCVIEEVITTIREVKSIVFGEDL